MHKGNSRRAPGFLARRTCHKQQVHKGNSQRALRFLARRTCRKLQMQNGRPDDRPFSYEVFVPARSSGFFLTVFLAQKISTPSGSPLCALLVTANVTLATRAAL